MPNDPYAPELRADDFRVLLDRSPECVMVHDAATKAVMWANRAACELLGWSVAELRTMTATDMSSSAGQYSRVLGHAWLQVAVDAGSNRIEWHYRTRAGRVVPTAAVAVRVELGHGPALILQFRDIEREQRVERELRRTASLVDALAHHTTTAALLLDDDGHLRYVTESARRLLGVEPEEPLGRLVERGRLRIGGRQAGWAQVRKAATPVQLEVTRDSSSVWLEGSVEPLAEDDGLLMIVHDVSSRVAGEQERERDNYLARYTAMGDMAMALAHELGQPLAAAGNFLAGARPRVAPDAAAEVGYGIDGAVRQLSRASAIVNSVRSFVGHLEHIDEVIDLGDVVRECFSFVLLRADPVGVRVVLDLAADGVPVRCERVLTGQVLLNLCFNAIDEMAAGGGMRELVIGTARGDGVGVLTVDDRGRGLTRDPFAVAFTDKTNGSGIGLALSHRIITRQHGSIWAEPRKGGGTRFACTLPLG